MFKICFSALAFTFVTLTSSVASPINATNIKLIPHQDPSRGNKIISLNENRYEMQVPPIQDLPNLIPREEKNRNENNENNENSKNSTTCIEIENNCIFEIAATETIDIKTREKTIQLVINEVIKTNAFKNKEEIKVWQQGENNNIFIQVGDNLQVRLMNVTQEDAAITGVSSIDRRGEEIISQLQKALELKQQQIQPDYLRQQAFKAIAIAAVTLLISLAITGTKNNLQEVKAEEINISPDSSERIETQLTKSQKSNLTAVKRILLDITGVSLWIGSSVLILGLFPQTILLQQWAITALRIPVRLSSASIVTYVLIRLSYALIARLSSALTRNSLLLVGEANRRLQLRIGTITKVTQGIVTVSFSIVGVLVGLAAIGIDIAPILAGAGIIGLAVSFASQSIIKDTINGFLIIAEDQYAVGDIISVGQYAGLVENINLRITQLRDAEGRLITIPNSEITTVANLSSHWSRADLNIPVAYNTDVDRALATISEVAQKMSHDPHWKQQILESPEVLGVDNFSDRGAIVRVWIKTQPLQQWAVSREFRRRIKIAFDRAGIPIPMPQQQVWFQRDRHSPSLVKQNNQEINE